MRKSMHLVLVAVAALMILGLGVPVLAGHDKGNVDELRFSDRVGADGEVAPNTSKDHFAPQMPIHITMRVEEAPRGTALLVNILDRETEELAWSEEQTVPGGHAVMHFLVEPGELDPGKYRARVRLGEDWVAEYEFKIE